MAEPNKNPLFHFVLLRGLARESRHWGEFSEQLPMKFKAENFDSFVTQIDFPGCGRHSEMRAKTTVNEMALFAREKLQDELMQNKFLTGQDRPVFRILVAISLGGMVASEWLANHPADFDAAVLINSSLRGLSKFYERMRISSWHQIPRVAFAPSMAERERVILGWVSNSEEAQKRELPRWISIQESRPVTELTMLIQLLAAARYKAPEKIAVPLLVLTSKKDRMVNPEASRAIATKYNAVLVQHESAGHDLTLDDGPWVAGKIYEWAAKQKFK